MRRHFVSGFPRALLSLSREKSSGIEIATSLSKKSSQHLAGQFNQLSLKETKYFKQEPIQRRFDFSDVLYFGWPNQPSSGTMRVYIELLLCTYIYIVNGC